VLSPAGKEVYLLIDEFRPGSIWELATKGGISRKLAAKECRRLASLGWVSLVKSGQNLRPIALIPEACQQRMVLLLQASYEVASNKGEFLMKRCLDLWVRSDEFVENARPAFLTNPTTGDPLEYDRYYLQKMAFEFNGTQHYKTTEEFSDEKELAEVIQRDLVKEALSRRNGVTLVTVTSSDLNPATFTNLLPEGLVLNNVMKEGPYFEALCRICAAYRAKAARLTKTAQPAKSATKT
jgi:hypothetical protein